MATEQLKYDFELNLARAEKNIDRFITNFETRMDRASTRMERAFEKISRGAGSGGGRSGGGGGGRGLEREVDRVIRRQTTAQREITRQQKQQARELAADKAKFDREEAKRVRERDRRRKQQAKDVQRDENAKQPIVDQYEQKRRTRKESIDNISSRAELRSRGRIDRIDWEQEDEQALAKALKARHRFVAEVARITKESSWKSTATVGREIAEQEQIYKGALDRIAVQHKAQSQDRAGGGSRMRKFSSGAFQIQRMIEDGSYAGWRGISNNLAFLGATIGGTGGLAIVAAVAAKGLYDLGAAMMGTGEQADKLSARVSNATAALDHMVETRRRLADEAIDFTVPGSEKEMARRTADLRRRREKITNNPDIALAGSELSKLKELERIYSTLRRGGNFFDPLGTGSGFGEWAQYLTTGPTSPIGMGMGAMGERLDMATTKRLRQQFKDIQGSLTDPNLAADPGKLSGLVADREKALVLLQRQNQAIELSIDAEEQRLAAAKQVFEQKKQISLLEDDVTDKLREQQRAEERLADTARDRAKAVRDAILSASDLFEGKMLDARSDQLEQQFSKRIDRMVDIDARRQRNAFNRMFPMANDRQKENFETWLQGRGDSVRQSGEQDLFNRQFLLAQERAKALKSRADQEASAARAAGRRGDLEGMNDGYAKAVKSLEQIQDLNWSMQSRGENPARSQAWLKTIEEFQGQIAAMQNEQARANDNLANSHEAVTKELEATEARLKQITTQIEAMTASDEQAAEPWRKVNAELDGTLKRLKELEAMKSGRGRPTPAPAAPPPTPAAPAGGKAPPGRSRRTNAERSAAMAEEKRRQNGSVEEVFLNGEWKKLKESDAATVTTEDGVRFNRGSVKVRSRPLPGKQNWVTPDRWGAEGNFQGVGKAQTYATMVRKALRSKEDELLQNPKNEGIRRRLLGAQWRAAGPVFKELDSGAEISARRAEQLAEELQTILEAIKAIDGYGPVKVPIEIIERHHAIVGPGGKTRTLPPELIGMPRGFREMPRPKFRAQGGPVSKNSPYIVGENGHELFIPSTGGYVVNATDTRKMMSGGHKPSPNIAASTSNTFTNNYGGVTIQTASVNLSDIQRQTDWREKARKARMGN